MTKLLTLACALTTFAVATGWTAQIAEITDIRQGELEMVGFTLDRDADIDISAMGLHPRKGDDLWVYAWVIDEQTRQPVWVMEYNRTDRVRDSRFLREEETTEHFKKGSYILHMYASDNNGWYFDGNIIGILGDIFDAGDGDDDLWRDLDQCFVRLEAPDLGSGDISFFDPDGGFPNALIRHNRLRDDEYIQTAFELKDKGDLHIYALVEYPRGNRHPVDYSWIVNAETREKVWEIDKWNVDYAGGGRKNQLFDDNVTLDKGKYVLYVVTDDSHSYEDFNVAPPYDPINWGITISPGKDFKKGNFAISDVPTRGKPLVDLTRARDNDFLVQSFKLDKEMDLNVYAIGEYASREFADYGAIKEAGTGRIVWEMTRRNTEHAGGGEKNRMFDGTVTLEPGLYTAYFVTDGSHSYRDWNTSPPYDEQSYGLAIYPTDNFDAGAFKLVSEEDLDKAENVLARITRVGDGERVRQRFTLDKEAQVHIYAIGEGTGGRMYDYAYIIDVESGRDVWEMTWRKTDHAGGASKNRMVDETIDLDAGTYEVVFVTDDSHSFNDWNSAPPRDPMNWGVTISLAPKR